MTFLILWILATIDSAFIGFREAAGRSALIDKRRYYRRALVRGALFGQLAVVLVGVAALAVTLGSPDPGAAAASLTAVMGRMLWVYIPYAAVLLLTFAIRLSPSVDLRSITSVVVFGPGTLVRPFVVAAGLIVGFAAAPTPSVLFLCLLTLSLMLGLEWAIGKLRIRGWVT